MVPPALICGLRGGMKDEYLICTLFPIYSSAMNSKKTRSNLVRFGRIAGGSTCLHSVGRYVANSRSILVWFSHRTASNGSS